MCQQIMLSKKPYVQTKIMNGPKMHESGGAVYYLLPWLRFWTGCISCRPETIHIAIGWVKTMTPYWVVKKLSAHAPSKRLAQQLSSVQRSHDLNSVA